MAQVFGSSKGIDWVAVILGILVGIGLFWRGKVRT